jgi:truncated hemoglobin YjbI
MNIYDLLGAETIEALSRRFYEKVYADTDPEFRSMFPADSERAIRNQYEFLIQRFGGPPLYSSRKGPPALRARHARFAITSGHVQRWLCYMREAMIEVGIAEEVRVPMNEFLSQTACFLQNVDEQGNRIY